MMIEERLDELERQVKSLTEEVVYLRSRNDEVWATPHEVAEKMGCTYNNVLIKIRKGEIYADRRTGNPRVPMSQFKMPLGAVPEVKEVKEDNKSLRELVFGT